MAKDERLMQIALLLKAIDDQEENMAGLKAEYKSRMETLHQELNRLKYEILTGQQTIPLEPPPKQAA